MIKGLVTILTPAYNAGKLIQRLLDSVLGQTYSHISMIVMNDGSTDNTEEVVKSYIPKFERRGFELKIINQENVGQSGTINNGLKYVDGEYLVWPDSDDWYASTEAIAKLVSAFDGYGDDVGVSRCAYNRILEDDFNTLRVDYPCMPKEPINIFDAAVEGRPHFWLEPGGWMIRTKFIDELIPNREIFHSKLTGQNTQILWPYLFAKKCVSVEEPLFSYLIRKKSHSRGMLDKLDLKLRQQDEYCSTYINVVTSIKGLTGERRNQLIKYFKANLIIRKIKLCIDAGSYKKARRYLMEYLRESSKGEILNKLSMHEKLSYALCVTPFVRQLFSLYKHTKNKKRCIFHLILLLSILLNFCGFFIYVSPYLMNYYYKKSFSPLDCQTVDDLETGLKQGCLKMLGDDVATDESVIYYKTTRDYIHHILHGNKLYSVYQYGEYGYFLHFLFKYAENTNDAMLMRRIKDKIDNEVLDGNNFHLVRNDQVSYGCIFLDLLRKYGDSKYREASMQIFTRLDSLDKVNGVVLYREGLRRQDVDAIGLVCPFLNQYEQMFKNTRAAKLSANMINAFCRYGNDRFTGIPCQAYDTETRLKTGIANWGRGCGWFCLGILNTDKNSFDSISVGSINRLTATLYSLRPLYGQYLGVGNGAKPDMSATVMILYYLNEVGAIRIDKKQFMAVISPFVNDRGLIKYNSPSISHPFEKPNAFQGHHVTQALALYMLSRLD